MNEHRVKPGECMASIAKQYGFSGPDTLYNHAANAALRSKRPNMHLLAKDDLVYIPPTEFKFIPILPGKHTVLILKGKIALLKLVLEDFEGQPLAEHHYTLEVAPLTYRGTTDEQGELTEVIDASATQAKLTVYLDEEERNALHWPLEIGSLSPLPELAGVQARLNNLGYYCANEKGELEKTTQAAIMQFKSHQGLLPSTEIDSELTASLAEVYGL